MLINLRNKMTPRGLGFTLIEMMVVIAIIAILTLVALPNTQDKVIRGQIAEALTLADIAKTPIAAKWAADHQFLIDNTAAGLPAPDRVVNNYVQSLSVDNGSIHLTFGNRANALIQGKVLSLRPAVIADAQVVPVTWVCGYAAAPTNMSLSGDNRTDIEAKYLPPLCR